MEQIIYNRIKELADEYSASLYTQINSQMEEMQSDDKSHYLLYNVLGVSDEEGCMIDLYQNKGRFLYKYAGAFLEEAAICCIKYKYPEAAKCTIQNPFAGRPKTFEIDCLVGNQAHEIKWRDATTDGDHINKERLRVQAICNFGLVPVRVMFYYPQRKQAQKIQIELEKLYAELGGKYYYGNSAWNYIKEFTGTDLLAMLRHIAASRNVQ